MKPFGGAIGRWLRSADNPRGYPDLIIERAGHDALAASTSLVKPFTGRVVYCEDMSGSSLHLLRAAGVDAPAPHPDADAPPSPARICATRSKWRA
jgi:hypothetical protein